MRFTSAQMTGASPAPAASQAAKPTAAPVQVLKVPLRGEVHVRRTTNGLLATARDHNYRDTGEVFVPDGNELRFG